MDLKFLTRGFDKKISFELKKSDFLICDNYQENNIAVDYRLLLHLAA